MSVRLGLFLTNLPVFPKIHSTKIALDPIWENHHNPATLKEKSGIIAGFSQGCTSLITHGGIIK